MASERRLSWVAAARDTCVVFLIAGASYAALKPPFIEYLFRPFEGFAAVLPSTAWAACKVWTFWTVAAVIVGGLLLRSDPDLGLLDATIGGFLGVWIVSWVGANLLGPIGLFRSTTIWALFLAGGIWLWRSPPRVVLRPLSAGQKLGALTFVLIAPVLLIEQLGSPVPPFMDVLATPAGAQRILTFGLYLPFDNEPYGYFGPSCQLPGLEVFYAFLGLGSHTQLALLAETAAILPMAGLLILTTYRFGRAIAGDVAGGMATLFLFATILFRTLPYVHGRTVSFVLVGAGLAFFFDERRSATRLMLSALMLGTAVGTHAIIGSLGMMVVAATVFLWLLSGELSAAVAGVGLLVGAALIAFPEVAVGVRLVLPYPALPLLQLVGIVLVVLSARRLHGRTVRDGAKWLRWALAVFVIVALLWHPPWVMTNNHHRRFPLLVFGGGLGFVLMLWTEGAASLQRRRRVVNARPVWVLSGPVVLAMVLGIAIEAASRRLAGISDNPEIRFTIGDLLWKVDYWYPYVLLFPTGFLAAEVYRRISPRVAVFLVLAVLMFPWRDRVDPDLPPQATADPNYSQHSMMEGWIYHLLTGKGGYWGSTADHRWAQSSAELALMDVLRNEVAAGRITTATRLVHLEAEYVYLYKDNLLFSVYTGIHDDPYVDVGTLDWDRSSRLRPIEQVHTRLAERPPYVAIRGNPPIAPEELRGYTEIFNRDGVRLLREESVTASTS